RARTSALAATAGEGTGQADGAGCGGVDGALTPSVDPAGCATPPIRSVGDETEHVVALELLPALEGGELDDEGDPDDLAAESLDELDLGPGGAAGGEQVVVHEHVLARLDGVGVHLEPV